jgi:NAD(P)-dependent dehydrogenase (short-subunit alcohol dehydrogenase family)
MDISTPGNAVITGAGSGLGRSFAMALAGRGWKLGLVDRNEPQTQVTLGMVEGAGAAGVAYRCDVSDPRQVEQMAKHFFSGWGQVNLLVNCAGVIDLGDIGDVTVENWRRAVEVDLMGVVWCCNAFVPPMKEQHGRSHIVNVASLAGIACLPQMGPYNVAKAGVIALSDTMKVELAPYRIGITVVCPSYFDTNLLDTMTTTGQEQVELMRLTFDNARMGADRIAELALRAVNMNRLYVLPQMSSKLIWANKRIWPSAGSRFTALLYRVGIGMWLLKFLARHGLA